MALLLCPDCGKKYSSSLDACPSCHSPAARASEVRSSSDGTAGRREMHDLDLSGATRKGWLEGMLFKGKYELVQKLGRGAYGEAWKAKDLEASDSERIVHVVLKLLPRDVSGSHVELLRVRKNFQKVHDLFHPRIAAHLAFEQDAGDCMVVMELVPGVTLGQYRLEHAGKHGDFPVSEAVRLCRQIAEGIDYAHSRQVAHRDIKPDNIMVTPEGGVKILDFGLAAEIRTSMNRVSKQIYDTSGTRPYMAPEQWRSLPPQYGTDQYALAVVFYELLSGDPPFLSDDPGVLRECVLHDPPQPLPMVSEAQNRALLKALAKDPAERFASCTAFIDAVEGGLRETASTLPAAQSGGAWRWIAAAALIMLAAGAYFMLQSSREAAARQAEQEAAGLAEATAKAEADAAAAAPAPGGQSSEAERASQAELHAADKAKRAEDYANLMKTGREYLLANRYVEAEASFAKAMTVEGYAADEEAAAGIRAVKYARLMEAGEIHLSAKRFDLAETSFGRAKEIPGYASDVKAEAGLGAVAKARAQDELERQRAEAQRQRDVEYARHMDEGEAHLRGNRFVEAETAFGRAMMVEGYELDEKAVARLEAVETARSEWEAHEKGMQAWVNEQPLKLGEKSAEHIRDNKGVLMGPGTSLMMIAARQGRVDVMRWLKENGEDINAKSNYGWTPFDHARSSDEAKKWLTKNGGMSSKELKEGEEMRQRIIDDLMKRTAELEKLGIE